MTYIQIGSISISAVWIAAIVALFVSPILHRVITGSKVGEWYWNSFFLYLLVWKLSYILFNLHLFLKTPVSILYFNGGTKGHLLALALTSIYLLFFTRKKYPFIAKEAMLLFALYFICYELTIGLLHKSVIESMSHSLLLAVFMLIVNRNNKKRTGQLFILFALLEIFIISIFRTALSLDVLSFIWLGITVLIMSNRK